MAEMSAVLANAVTALVSNLTEVPPEMADILDKIKRGELDHETSMKWLMETIQGNPDLAAKFQALVPVDHNEAESPRAVFVPREGRGMPRLNPMYEAALIETAQFDGDLPHLRTGDLPVGILPAMPVKTKARNPVAIGAMLGRAAAKMQKELTDRTQQRRALADAAMAGDSTALAKIQQHGAILAAEDFDAIVQGSAQDDPQEYRRGQAPKPIAVRRSRGSTLLKMTEAEKHEMAWRFLSTTQGRRSAVESIQDLVAVHLGNKGLAVEVREYGHSPTKVKPLAYKDWCVILDGPGATQPAFALIDVAAKVLANGLLKDLGDGGRPEISYLEVEPVNEVDIRTVGWMARLMPYS